MNRKSPNFLVRAKEMAKRAKLRRANMGKTACFLSADITERRERMLDEKWAKLFAPA